MDGNSVAVYRTINTYATAKTLLPWVSCRF